MIRRDHPKLSLSRQCRLLSISRSSLYHTPKGESAQNLALMRRIDELFLKYPFYGSRQMVRHLWREGVRVGRHRVRRLMRLMGLQAIYQAPRTTRPHPDEVAEILRSPYSGREFPGYENIHLPFHELEALVRKDTQNWKAPLESVKGVYLITDTRTGRHYVGSAYGDQGVWSRWSDYVHSGHGNNTEFRKLAKDPLKYARQNFQFTLLEHHFERTSHDVIQEREAFWKNTLLTREKGLNRN